MNICVIGTGYVGLVAGTCLADTGNTVICVDSDKAKIDELNKGVVSVFEPGLSELIKINTKENRLFFTSDLNSAVKKSKVCFIAVGTPSKEDGTCDLSAVYSVAEQIAKNLNEYKIIVNKSTVPVGTAEKLSEFIKKYTKEKFDVVSNPEFLKQGAAVDDFMSPDRVIIGTSSKEAAAIMQDIYSPYMRTTNRLILTDAKSAEMVKYASNAFLAAKISFINEIADLCEKTGANIAAVRTGMIADERIGKKFLFPGIGFGGSCFPKDISALISLGEETGCDCSIIKAVKSRNQKQREIFVEKILNYFDNDIKGKKIAVWGLSFKPKTNDMREAPSVTVINKLLESGAVITAYDPKAIKNAEMIFGDKIAYSDNAYDALNDACALLLLTEWNEFRYPDVEKMKNLMKNPVIFDARNQYDKTKMNNNGFTCINIGNAR